MALDAVTEYAPLLSGVMALLLGIPLVAAVRHIARARGLVASPRADRWHSKPTALHGGFAIWVAALAGFAAAVDCTPAIGILAGGTLMFVLGAVDDFLNLRPITKIAGQLVAAGVAVGFGFRISFFGSEIVNIAASFFWIIAITNAVNLLDNMDGLASGVVMIAALYLGMSNLAAGQPVFAALAFALVGALIAFLVFNFNPASIFMGDSGSQFLGFSISTLALAKPEASNVLAFVAVPAMTLLVPMLDTSLVTVTRILAGRSVAQGGRDHSSHRLVGLGLSEREAVIAIWLLGGIAGGAAAMFEYMSYTLGLALLPFVVIGFGLVGVYLSQVGTTASTTNASDRSSRLGIVLRRGLERLCDLTTVGATYYLAYGLRFDFQLDPHWQARYIESLPIVLLAAAAAFHQQRVYRSAWRLELSSEVPRLARAVALSVGIGVLGVVATFWSNGYSRSVFLMHGALLFLTLTGARFSFGLLDTFFARRRRRRRALVLGVGPDAALCVQALTTNEELGLWPVAFLDDEESRRGQRIAGLTVLGRVDEIERCYAEMPFEEIVVAVELPELSRQRVIRFAQQHALHVRSFRLVIDDWTIDHHPLDRGSRAEERIAQ